MTGSVVGGLAETRPAKPWLLAAACVLSLASAGLAKGDESAGTPQTQDREAIARLLDVAWSGEQTAAESTRELYDSLNDRVTDRVRWDYAYGIACLKLKRFGPASQAFRAAINGSKQFPVSAWKGLVWAELSQKRYEPGLAQLEAFAKAVVEQKSIGTASEQEAAAVWIGQTLGGLDKIVTAPKVRQRLADTEARLDELWPDALRDAAQSGRDYADMLYAELTEDLKQATDKAKAQEQAAKQEKQKKLSEKSAEAEKQREGLKKSAENLEKQTKERVEQIDKQLERLERDYGYLQSRAQSVLQSMMLAQNQMLLAQSAPAGAVNANPLRMQGAQTMLNLYQQEYELTLMRGNMVVQRAMETAQLREQAARQLQQASKEIVDQDSSLGKWQERLKNNSEHLDKQKLKGKSPSVREKRLKAKTLSTYLEFDPEWERIHLIEQPEQ